MSLALKILLVIGLFFLHIGCTAVQNSTKHPWFTNEGTASFVHTHCGNGTIGVNGIAPAVNGQLQTGINSRTVSWHTQDGQPVDEAVLIAALNRPCTMEEAIDRALERRSQPPPPP